MVDVGTNHIIPNNCKIGENKCMVLSLQIGSLSHLGTFVQSFLPLPRIPNFLNLLDGLPIRAHARRGRALWQLFRFPSLGAEIQRTVEETRNEEGFESGELFQERSRGQST